MAHTNPRRRTSELAAGAIFGSALVASGVYLPNVILEQLQLRSFHMIVVSLGAGAASAVIVYTADKLDHIQPNIRIPRSAGLSPYDKNILGGTLVGTGMALTGACPGTVLVQLATGAQVAPYIVLGGLMGGLANIFSPLERLLPQQVSVKHSSEKTSTLQAMTGLSTENLLFIYEAAVFAVILFALSFGPERIFGRSRSLSGGLLIGAAQALTVLMTRHTIGVSTAYADIARWIVSKWQRSAQANLLGTPSISVGNHAGQSCPSAIGARHYSSHRGVEGRCFD